MKLSNSLYDAIVVSDETDGTLSGAVRISVFGVTDGIEDEFQPKALPGVNSMMGVPTKGTYLKVYFEEGDVHQPVYFGTSPQTSFLPQEYIDNYPNVSVANLGSDSFQKTHDSSTKVTRIEHDSSSKITWDALGVITHESEKGYGNTGFGAKQNNGKPVQPVLTEGTVDIFTCTPFAGGSEYLKVTHISNASVKGTIQREQQLSAQTPATEEDSGVDAPVTKPLLEETVEFLQAKNSISIPNRKVKIVLIGNTGVNDFANSINSILSSTISAHYVIGRSSEELIQMIELTKAGTFGSKGIWNKETAINKIAISVLLCGDGKSTASTPSLGGGAPSTASLGGAKLSLSSLGDVKSAVSSLGDIKSSLSLLGNVNSALALGDAKLALSLLGNVNSPLSLGNAKSILSLLGDVKSALLSGNVKLTLSLLGDLKSSLLSSLGNVKSALVSGDVKSAVSLSGDAKAALASLGDIKSALSSLGGGAPSTPSLGGGASAFTPDQYNNLNKIIANARQQFGNEIEIVTIDQADPLMIGMFGTSFDRSRVI